MTLLSYHSKIRLNRHKELLKKDILKKRVLLEKELQIEIQKELSSELAELKQEKNTTTAGKPGDEQTIMAKGTAVGPSSNSKRR